MVSDVVIDRVAGHRSGGVLVGHDPSSGREHAVNGQGAVVGLPVDDVALVDIAAIVWPLC